MKMGYSEKEILILERLLELKFNKETMGKLNMGYSEKEISILKLLHELESNEEIKRKRKILEAYNCATELYRRGYISLEEFLEVRELCLKKLREMMER